MKHCEGPLDPRTPSSWRQFSERVEDDGYQGLSAVDLAARAAAEALADPGVEPGALARRIDTVGGIRQFEISTPNAPAPPGRSTNYPRSVANRLVPTRPERSSIQVRPHPPDRAPPHRLADAGGVDLRSEAISTVDTCRSDDPPDFSDTRGQPGDRGLGLKADLDQLATMGWSMPPASTRCSRTLAAPAWVWAARSMPRRWERSSLPSRGWQPRTRTLRRRSRARRRNSRLSVSATGSSRSPTPGSLSPATRSTRRPRCC